MSKKVEFKLNSAGVKQLLKSAEMQAGIMQIANQAVSRLGDGYVAEQRSYPERTGAAVKAESFRARKENLKMNTILKAVCQK